MNTNGCVSFDCFEVRYTLVEGTGTIYLEDMLEDNSLVRVYNSCSVEDIMIIVTGLMLSATAREEFKNA